MTDSTPLVQQNNKKQGHRVFCCCDSRKATILVSLVALILNIIFLIGYATGNHANSVWAIVVYSISIAFYLLVIFGAIRYHRCAVIISLIWQLVAVVLIIIGTIQFDWSSVSGDTKTQDIIAVTVALIWYLVVIYSLGTFVREVSNGIMSPATHSREKYACCCNV